MNDTARIRILVVDDDPGVRAFVRRALEAEGYEVAEAADGAECLRVVRQVPPDLIILDLYMPEKDGLEVLRELHVMSSGPRLITMSGGGPTYDMAVLRSSRFLGASSALVKPFSTADLLEAVRGVIGGERNPRRTTGH